MYQKSVISARLGKVRYGEMMPRRVLGFYVGFVIDVDSIEGSCNTVPETESEYWETIKKLDIFTAKYIGNKITELEVKNFEEYQNNFEWARVKDYTYRECARIISDIIDHKKLVSTE